MRRPTALAIPACGVSLVVASVALAMSLPGSARAASDAPATSDPEPTPARGATILVAGDIASCEWRADAATARLVRRRTGIVMTAGDHAYPLGTARTFRDCYGPTWGRFRGRTRPVPGNHDRATAGARPYFDYFGARAGPPGRGYYAFDAGSWRVYALDSSCWLGDRCRKGSAQYRWLERDLERHPVACSMAVLHHPTYTSGPRGNGGRTRPLIRLLYRAGAELVVNGHDHFYERFAPARPWGRIDRRHGVRQFIVGTGGAPLYGFRSRTPGHSRVRQNRVHGILWLRLEPDAYAWRFIPVRRGAFDDRGSSACHGPPPGRSDAGRE